ncbi:MAG: hypothetical protein ABIG35_01280 [Pseudomonadota bacterium]
MAEYISPGAEVFGEGHHPNTETTFLELHRLLAIIFASKSFAELRVGNGEEWDPIDHLQQFEDDEITRILLSVSITARVIDDRYDKVFDLVAGNCGSLFETDEKGTTESGLTLREACNKIIHAQKIRFDISETEATQRYLNPIIYLYGERRKGQEWKAVLNVIDFAKEDVSCLRIL